MAPRGSFVRFRAGLVPDVRPPFTDDYRGKRTPAQRARSLRALRRGKRQTDAAKRWGGRHG
jgi:hypothetical protein